MSAVDNESLAEGFAAEGREELLIRFRDAYAKAAGTHSDYVSFDADTLESMVQRSVAEADGLQWRRALAGVAARELGIELGAALTHPAVVRAHQLTGAPSYEKALSELAVPVPPAPVAPVPEPPALVKPAAVETVAEPVAPVDAPAAADPPAVPAPDVASEAEAPAEVADPPVTSAEPEAEPTAAAEAEPAAAAEAELTAEELPEPLPGVEDAEFEVEELLAVEEPLAVEEAPAEDPAADEPFAEAPAAEAPLVVEEVDAPVESPLASVDEPTMAYEIPVPTDDPVAAEEDAEELDSVAGLSHDAEAEFEPADVALDEDEDDFTYEHDVLPEGEAAGGPATNGELATDDTAEFTAVHLGGVASLPSSEEIALRLSEEGLDLMQDDGTIVGRLGWEDIAALEVTVPHGRRRRKGSPRLVVHTSGGSARFEVPSLSGEELQEQLQPLMARYGH